MDLHARELSQGTIGGAPAKGPPPFGRWVALVVGGEVLGFTLAALVGFIVLVVAGPPQGVLGQSIALVVMTGAGVLEGASLGTMQWLALRYFMPRLRWGEWLLPTIAVTAGGWCIGMAIPLGFEIAAAVSGAGPVEGGQAGWEPSDAQVLFFSSVLGALIGAVFGAVQHRVLRSHAHGAEAWIAGNAVGWGVGLPATYVAGGLGSPEMSVTTAIALASVSALFMGLSVAVATWGALRRLRPIA